MNRKYSFIWHAFLVYTYIFWIYLCAHIEDLNPAPFYYYYFFIRLFVVRSFGEFVVFFFRWFVHAFCSLRSHIVDLCLCIVFFSFVSSVHRIVLFELITRNISALFIEFNTWIMHGLTHETPVFDSVHCTHWVLTNFWKAQCGRCAHEIRQLIV